MLNLLSGYYRPTPAPSGWAARTWPRPRVQRRAVLGIARTFQKPRLLGSADRARQCHARRLAATAAAGFVASAFALPQARREDRIVREQAVELLHGVGLGHALARRANLLEHAEQRFLEIARGLVMRPRFILLDEPAGGLTGAEIEHLGRLLRRPRCAGIGVLLVEHHTDFVFRVCDRVTTLDRRPDDQARHGPRRCAATRR